MFFQLSPFQLKRLPTYLKFVFKKNKLKHLQLSLVVDLIFVPTDKIGDLGFKWLYTKASPVSKLNQEAADQFLQLAVSVWLIFLLGLDFLNSQIIDQFICILNLQTSIIIVLLSY